MFTKMFEEGADDLDWDSSEQQDNLDDGWGEGDGDDDWDMEDKGATEDEKEIRPPALVRSNSFMVMDGLELALKQEQLIKMTAEVLFIDESEADLLLRHYGWKDAKLRSEWFNDQNKVRATVGLCSERCDEKDGVFPDGTVQCQSAYCDRVPKEEADRLNCGHWFCSDCWSGYLESQIRSGSQCIFASCMGIRCKLDHPHKFGCACNEKVPTSFFTKHVKDEELMKKYHRWLMDSFVEGQNNIKWCPKPNCGNSVIFTQGGTQAITCKCGHSFCFSCLEEAHSPAPCDLVKQWMVMDKSDDATAIWLAARTKECPNCQVRIEKNKACNHMTCAKCKHHFCWLCKGPWSQHGTQTGGYYACTKYDADKAKGSVSEEENKIVLSNRFLQKYTYYYKRFKGSADGIDLTQKRKKRVESEIKDDDLSKYTFLFEAFDKLISARRVLQWTYCLAYFLQNGGKKHLFEYQQELLMGNTEALQDIIENKQVYELLEMRKEIINRTSSIDKFRAEMTKQVERGDFEDLLQTKADAEIDVWACSTCRKDNKMDASHCVTCTACRLHGEMECKLCKPKK